MNTKVTIRDVAERAGVSISSVHFALSGKAGVSDETRERIRRTAEEMGYQPNTLASSLKRSTQRIAILLPTQEGGGQYYYRPVWRGVHDYLSKVNMNLECIELPYSSEDKGCLLYTAGDDQKKQPPTIVWMSDIHYLTPALTDYGPSFQAAVEADDGKLTGYTPQLLEAFIDEVIELHPCLLYTSRCV